MPKRLAAVVLFLLGLLVMGALVWQVLDGDVPVPEPLATESPDAAPENAAARPDPARSPGAPPRRRRVHAPVASEAPPSPEDPATAEDPAPETARVAVVRDEAGRPIPGARVEVRDATGRWQGTSGADGTFARDGAGPVARQRRIRVTAPGFAAAEPTVTTDEDWVVVLRGEHRLAGLVLDASGQRVADVAVTVVPVDSGGHSWGAQTGPTGTFELEHLPPGEFEVTAESAATPTRRPGHATATAPADTLDLELRLGPALGVRGRVVDEAGRPFEGDVSVVMRAVLPNGDAGSVWTGKVAEDGTFVVPDVNSSTNVLWAWLGEKEAGVAMTVLRDLPPGEPSIDVVLKAGRVIKARVADDQGKTLSGSAHWYVIAGGHTVNSAIANAGEIVTHPLPYDGRYDLVVYHEAGWTGQVRDARPGTQDLVVAMRRAREITGVVLLPDGEPAGPGLVVRARSLVEDNRGRTGIEASVETDADGSFRISGVADLPFVISTWPAKQGYAPARAPGTYEPGSDVTLRLARGTSVTGRIARADGEPTGTLKLWFLPTYGTDWSRTLTTGGDGAFSAGALPAGPLRVVAYRPTGNVLLGEISAPAKDLRLILPTE